MSTKSTPFALSPALLPQGLGVFLIIWLGQLVSTFGSGLTGFALGLWVYQSSGSVTQYALIALCATLPRILLSPLAGVLVDRWSRRRTMLLSDLGAGLCTLALALLLFSGRLTVWHVYLATALSAAFGAFQYPAYASSITLLVPEKHLGRANGLVQVAQSLADIFAPLAAGFLVLAIRVQGVMLIDFATFLVAVLTLLLVRIPNPQRSPHPGAQPSPQHASHPAEQEAQTPQDQTPVLRAALQGWQFIAARPGLVALLVFFALFNFVWGMVGALAVPMVLGFASPDQLGVLMSAAGGGLLLGGLAMSAWGGPRRRITGVLLFEFLSGVCFVLMGLRPSLWLVALGAIGAHATIAIISGCSQAIWQSKVAPEMQGRVFATQQMISSSAVPLALLLAGPLAEKVFEPWLAVNGPLAASLGGLLGAGPGRGTALLFLCLGALKALIALSGALYPPLRKIE